MKKSDYLKRLLRRAAAGSLFLLMGAAMLVPGNVQAANSSTPKNSYRSLPASSLGTPAPETRSEFALSAASLPKKYSSVSKKYITKVKNQGDFGACWTFANMNALEASAIRNKVKVAGKAPTNKNFDLSEYQLAYFFYHKKTDPLKLITGDYATAYDYLQVGGNNCLTSMYLASWAGPTREKIAPYSKAASYPSLANSKAFTKDILHVQNVYWADMNDRTKVKQLIKQFGAVSISYYMDEYYLNNSTGAYYVPEVLTDYYGNLVPVNHAVSIVGWDDNYSKSKFGYYSPSRNGAWLVKNSWGSGWGNNGYFWLSYEDAYITYPDFYINTMAVAYGTTPATTYKYNYQYDGGSYAYGFGTTGGNPFAVGNIYKSVGSQTLKAVGFASWFNNQKYSIQIYKNPKKGKPTTGKKMLSKPQTGTINAGFRTIKLKKAIKLKKGDRFSVVITYRNSSGWNTCVMDRKLDDMGLVTAQKAGQSYFIYKGKSYDCATKYAELDDPYVAEPMTARIKAYTTK